MQIIKRRLYCIHIPARRNVGDAVSAPHLYFDAISKRYEVRVISIGKLEQIQAIEQNAPILVGGGGLLAYKAPWDAALRAALDRSNNVMAWGIGLNRSLPDARRAPRRVPEFARAFRPFGLRDWIEGEHWVPCASCMAPAFDSAPPPAREDLGFYLHVDRVAHLPAALRSLPGAADALTNGHDRDAFAEIIAHLARYRTLITNSYHGMYWATLLGRRVILFDVFSEKFELSRWKHAVYANDHPLPDIVLKSLAYPTALEEAREANQAFMKEVEQHL